MLSRFSHVQLFAILRTVTTQAPLSMGFSRQEHWSGLHAFFRGPSRPRDRICISYVSWICRWILYLLVKTSLVAQMVKHLSTMWETRVRSLGREDPLEKEMAIHSSTIAWKIPWTEEPGRLQSMGSQRVRHDWATDNNKSIYWLITLLTLFSLVPSSMLWVGSVIHSITQMKTWGLRELRILPKRTHLLNVRAGIQT